MLSLVQRAVAANTLSEAGAEASCIQAMACTAPESMPGKLGHGRGFMQSGTGFHSPSINAWKAVPQHNFRAAQCKQTSPQTLCNSVAAAP